MSKIEEKIDKAANRFADTHHSLLGSNNKSAYKGFIAGAKWALSHQWISVERELPENDKDVLAALKNGLTQPFITVAWCSKADNGKRRWYSSDDNLNLDLIRYWMPIPPPPETRKEDGE